MSWNECWRPPVSNAELIPHIQAAMVEVLETMFFTSVMESSESAALPPVADTLFSRLSFSGPPAGAFEVGIPPDAARSLATGFLGDDESSVCESRTREVVCELTNMLCGSVLSRIAGGAAFELSHPGVVDRAMETPTARVHFELPEGPLSAAIRIEGAL
jgi:hypothetical protein